MDGPLGGMEIGHLDGGPVRVVASDLPGPVVGALSFRVGSADESFPQRGITHLVEHLAMFGVTSNPRLETNGFVELDRTMLWARGSREDVFAFLTQAANGITRLPVGRIPDEVRVLQTEAAGRSGSLLERLLRLRFGGSGYGMGDYVEKGMGWLVADAVQQWANRWFCAENCVCVLTCPPDGLVLELPSGARADDPPIETLPGLTFPAQLNEGSGTVSATFTTPRSWAAAAATTLAAQCLHDALRTQDAISYKAVPIYTRIGAEAAHLSLAADCLEQNAAKVRLQVWETIQAFASTGPEPDRLEEWKASWERDAPKPDELARFELDRVARELLWGREAENYGEWQDGRRRLTSDLVASAFAQAIETALLVVPATTPGALVEAPRFVPSSHQRPDGRLFRFRSGALNPKYRRRRVVVSESAVCLVKADGTPVTISAQDCIGAEVRDGMLRLSGRDGSWLAFKPGALRHSDAAQRAIQEVIPPSAFLGGEGASTSPWASEPLPRWSPNRQRLALRIGIFAFIATSMAANSTNSTPVWIAVAVVLWASAVTAFMVKQ